MIWNMTGGGGGVATIFVSYPYSSTVTCTNGSATLTATNSTTSRAYTYFNVPSTGTWTVSCRNNNFSDSATVSVSVGETYYVELHYKSYIVQEGILKVTPQFNDANQIKQNLDPNGNDCYESYCKPRHIWMFCTFGWDDHHAEVMFPVNITYATRLVYESGSEYTPPGGGGTPTNNKVYHTDRGFVPNLITSTNKGTNRQMATIYNGGGYAEGLNMIDNFVYFDLEGFTGSGYATIGWEAGTAGNHTRVEVKNYYVEY